MPKLCRKCNRVQELERFALNKAKPDGRASTCKDCANVYAKGSYKKKPQYYKTKAYERSRALVAVRVKWWNEYKASLACEKCGAKHPAILDFHHRNPSEKRFAMACIISSNKSDKTIMTELAKCDVLCSNCHRILHWEEKEKAA